jgi:hypothetical protein
MKLADGRDLRIVDENNSELKEEEIDYEQGYLRNDFILHDDGTWEDVMRYYSIPEKELNERKERKKAPSQEDRLKAMEDALMTMMLGGGSNV